MLLFPSIDPQALHPRALVLDINGTPESVVTVEDLIALKQKIGHPIDLDDGAHLQAPRTDKP